MSNVRSKYPPILSAKEKARWAYQLAIVPGQASQTVIDDCIDHAGSTRADVEAFIDSLAADGCLTVMRSVGGQRSFFSIVHP